MLFFTLLHGHWIYYYDLIEKRELSHNIQKNISNTFFF